MSQFEFTVELSRHWDTWKPKEPNVWRVHLPHSCDEWVITGGYDGVPKDQAIVELEAFIAEAQAALTALRDDREGVAP